MKIGIVAPSPVPFCIGGAENLWWGLKHYINQETRHQAELIKLPSREHSFWELVDSYEEFSRLDVSHFDVVISSKYPAWMVKHPNHVCYMLHRLRGLYDTYHFCQLPLECRTEHPRLRRLLEFMLRHQGDPARLDECFQLLRDIRSATDIDPKHLAFPGPLIRQVVRFLDGAGLAPSRISRYVAMSGNVAGRADYFPDGTHPKVVYAPTNLRVVPAGKARYLFTVGRLDGAKRVRLMIEAMKLVKADIPLKIAGTGPDEKDLHQLADGDPRIQFLGFVNDDEVAGLYADALAAIYVPYDEDYGLVTIEAMLTGKPVLTVTDSGGPLEFVTEGETGFICGPTARELAAKIEYVANNRELVLRMADACRLKVQGVTWGNFVSGLLGADMAPASSSAPRRPNVKAPKLTVAVTFPVFPPRGGGQSRVYHLYRHLAPDFQVDIVSIAEYGQPEFQGEIAPGLREIRIPKTLAHAEREWELSAQMDGVPVTDVVMPELYRLTPNYVRALAQSAADADILVASHPYLLPALEEVRDGQRLIYEAHNAEAVLKQSILPDTPSGRRFADLTRTVEGRACRSSCLTITCLENDALKLHKLYGGAIEDILVVPNGVDLESVSFQGLARRRTLKSQTRRDERFTALFIGSWHGPNIEAAFCLIEIARRLPHIKFLVVGSVGEYLRQFGFVLPENMECAGVVDDAAKDLILGTADLAVNPMESGSGTNLKMLDYMAAGIPTLSTPFGARGLNLEDGVTAFVAPLFRFPEAIEQIRRGGQRELATMIEQAREHVVREFAWSVIAGRFAATLRERCVVPCEAASSKCG